MLHTEQVALIQRALGLIEKSDTERGKTSFSPVSRYLDPERFDREVEHVFRRYPVALCASSSLSQAGDTLALDVAGVPILLVRAADGSLSGLINACRHRGARLVANGQANKRSLICPYHSWNYDLDGTLRGRPHAGDFPHAPAHQCSLARVSVGEALGLVWAIPRKLQPEESSTLDMTSYLGRFGEDLHNWGYDRWVAFDQREFPSAANWKIQFEANLETYHFQYAHRHSIAPLFYDNLLIADHDGDHQRLFLPKRSITDLRDVPRSEWAVGRHSNIIYYFFPATFILHEGDHCNLFSVLPEAIDRSAVRAMMLVPQAPQDEKALNHWRRNVDSFWGALSEDFALSESCQSTMASGANDALHFGSTEYCSARFHDAVERILDQAACGQTPTIRSPHFHGSHRDDRPLEPYADGVHNAE